MQYTDDAADWDEWIKTYRDADDATKLAALRQFIRAAAAHGVTNGDFTVAWANKKLAKLGVTGPIDALHSYELEAEVTGKVTAKIWAHTRAEALDRLADRFNNPARWTVASPKPVSAPVFTGGPEDVDPAAIAADAPATVDATLTALRETILLAVIAGPRICEAGANRVLTEFGLDLVPPRKSFTVTRPATVTMTTTVEAYDQASAERVGEWRWDDGQKSYSFKDVDPTGDLVTVEG